MDKNLSQVIKWISNLGTRKIQGENQEYKSLLILSVLELLEANQSHENNFSYLELLDIFRSKFPNSVKFRESQFSNPYFRLQTDNVPIQVWLLQPPEGVDKVKEPTNYSSVKRHCPFVKIDASVWEVFLNLENHSSLKKAIGERVDPAEFQSSLFDSSTLTSTQDHKSPRENEYDSLSPLQESSTKNADDNISPENLRFSDEEQIDSKNHDDLFQETYTLNEVFNATNIALSILEKWNNLLNRKKQIIFYGPPGTGKTFIAQQIAKHLIGGGNGFQELVQFHPAFTYEDFIQGIRPQLNQDGLIEFQNVKGRFLEFCDKARNRDCCVLIIDEINRANLSNVFGELMYLLEYRGKNVRLSSGIFFNIPDNVRIIGTMNTADRSIALVDYALRRRFAFISLAPDYDLLRSYHEQQNTNFSIENLIEVLQDVNRSISDPKFEIGISFFMINSLEKDLEDIWTYEIEPYLEEYFFSRPQNLEDFRWNRISSRLKNTESPRE